LQRCRLVRRMERKAGGRGQQVKAEETAATARRREGIRHDRGEVGRGDEKRTAEMARTSEGNAKDRCAAQYMRRGWNARQCFTQYHFKSRRPPSLSGWDYHSSLCSCNKLARGNITTAISCENLQGLSTWSFVRAPTLPWVSHPDDDRVGYPARVEVWTKMSLSK
jgi:hypothetical protein